MRIDRHLLGAQKSICMFLICWLASKSTCIQGHFCIQGYFCSVSAFDKGQNHPPASLHDRDTIESEQTYMLRSVVWKGIGHCLCDSLHSIFAFALPYFDSIPDSLLSRKTHVRRVALRVYYLLHREVVSGIRFRICKIRSRLPPSRGRVRDISCACEHQQGTIPSMFAVCNVDYIVDISSSDRIAREHF